MAQPPTIEEKSLEKDESITTTWADRARDYGARAQEQYQKLESIAKDRLRMEGLLKQARDSLEEFLHPRLEIEKQIPISVLQRAKGIVFLSILKAGLGLGGEMGSGVVMSRLPGGSWSPPLAIGAAGIQWGIQIGASKVDYIMVLFDDESVETFSGRGQLKIGGDANVSMGPFGRDADIGFATNENAKLAPIFSYAMSKGAYAGITLKGEFIGVRDDCNSAFYGEKATPKDILSQKVTMPQNDDWSAIGNLLDTYVSSSNRPSETNQQSEAQSQQQSQSQSQPQQQKQDKEKEKDKDKEKVKDKEKKNEKDKDKEIVKDKEKENEKDKDKEKVKDKEKENEKDKDKEKEKDKIKIKADYEREPMAS